jgi:hypothetical protein
MKSVCLRQILSVRCPICGAKPKEKCTLSTGQPSVKTHNDRNLMAAKSGRPENFRQATLRNIKATGSRLRILFHHN